GAHREGRRADRSGLELPGADRPRGGRAQAPHGQQSDRARGRRADAGALPRDLRKSARQREGAKKMKADKKKKDKGAREKLSRKDYDKQLKKLHVELVKLQEWVKHKGLKVCIVFEGRDGAGKGGTIKAITERVSPRVFRVVALTAPSEREKSQMY